MTHQRSPQSSETAADEPKAQIPHPQSAEASEGVRKPRARNSYRDELAKAKAQAAGNHANFLKERAKMNFETYREGARRTRNNDLDDSQYRKMAVYGLIGETGEIADHLKKVEFHGHDLDPEHVKKEVGDVLWYLDLLADTFGLSLAECAEHNLEKLRKRYGDKFSVEKSRNREQ